jgi:uncharacterized protein (DUF983 family)
MNGDKLYNGKVEQSLKDNPVPLTKSVIQMKCPRCRKGHLFVKKNPYVLRNSLNMPDFCLVCRQDFKIEPGFYIGALWASFQL